MTAQDRAYYMRRAEAELALATCAAHPAAMRAHYHLAGFYLGLWAARREPGQPAISRSLAQRVLGSVYPGDLTAERPV